MSFAELHALYPDAPGAIVALAFDALSPREQAECWAEVAEQRERWIDAELVLERELYEEPRRRHQRSTKATSTRPGAVALSSTDPLRAIPPVEYVERLTGEPVPANGVMCCPFPDHDDATPSFRVYSDHVWCFGCGRGGSIYGFAGALYAIEPRGSGFIELRRRIARELLGEHHGA